MNARRSLCAVPGRGRRADSRHLSNGSNAISLCTYPKFGWLRYVTHHVAYDVTGDSRAVGSPEYDMKMTRVATPWKRPDERAVTATSSTTLHTIKWSMLSWPNPYHISKCSLNVRFWKRRQHQWWSTVRADLWIRNPTYIVKAVVLPLGKPKMELSMSRELEIFLYFPLIYLRVAFVTDPQHVRINGALRSLSLTNFMRADFNSCPDFSRMG